MMQAAKGMWSQKGFRPYVMRSFHFYCLGAPFEWGTVLTAGSESCLIKVYEDLWTYTYKTQVFKCLRGDV